MQTLQNLKVGMISLGCVKNRVDSEQMLGKLTACGCVIVQDPQEAEILIVNTCGFIAPAKEESIDTIFEMAQYKKTGKCRLLCVTGCLSQRYQEALAEEIPEVDCLLGVSEYQNLEKYLLEALNGKRVSAAGRHPEIWECNRVLTTPPYSAYIKIGDGCDNKCAYCAIPLIRGGYRSRPRAAILNEIREMVQRGVREIVLVAQDTTRYGIDTGDSLASLMDEAARIPGVEWLRVLYTYPDEITQELLQVMAKHDNICKYLDLPLQHASPALLNKMNRRGTVEKTKEFLTSAREMGFCLRTTFIVGFPGETEKDFDSLMDFAREIRFDRMGAFAFSPEEDTPAYDMPDQLEESIKEQRLEKLMALQGEISYQRNLERVGTLEKVLVTGREGDHYTARSAWEAPDADGEILLESDQPLELGQFILARITGADTYDLSARAEEGKGKTF